MPKGLWNAFKLFLFACKTHNSGDENSETCDWCFSPHIEFSECKRDLLKTDMRYPQRLFFLEKSFRPKHKIFFCQHLNSLTTGKKRPDGLPCLHEFFGVLSVLVYIPVWQGCYDPDARACLGLSFLERLLCSHLEFKP